MASYLDHNDAIEALREQGHRIGQAYNANGRVWVVIDGVAMTNSDAIALAEGRVTLQQIKDAAERANAQHGKATGI